MNTSPTTSGPIRSRWGRSRFGGGSGALIAASLGGGAVLSLAIGWVATLTQPDATRVWLLFLVTAVVTLPVSSMLAWVLLVDRSTLAGAVASPEHSIEGQWYDRAAAGAFGDILVTVGIGAAVFSWVDIPVPTNLVFVALFTIAAVSFGLRYFVAKKAAS